MSADTIVKSYIDRILRLKEEQDALAADIREVYAEAKGNGFDKTAMGQLVAHLRKVEKVGISAVQEGQSIFDLYLEAYERASGTAIATHTHEASAAGSSRGRIAEFDSADAGSNPAPATIDPETGEITDTQEQPETAKEQRANVHPQHEVRPGNTSLGTKQQCNNAGVTVGGDERGTAVQFQSTEPTVDAVAETQVPRPTATATVQRPLNPDCRKAARGEQCALMHSQALCSKCRQAVFDRKAAAA